MKIAINVSPLTSGHSVRGIGFYTKTLVEELAHRKTENEYFFVNEESQIENISPDIIHYPFFDLFFLTAPIRKNIPVIVTLHDVTPLVLPKLFPKGIRGWIKLKRQLARLKKVDKIITDSVASKSDIARYCSINENKIETVYLACAPTFKEETDVKKITQVRAKYNLQEKYIIKVGDINRHKNFKVLFEAMTRISNIKLVLVGKALDEQTEIIPELNEINHTIKLFGLENRVQKLGFVPTEDMNALYTSAECTVQNSYYEGFGLTALESMTCGTPVIAGNTGSQPEILGSAGILINPYDLIETVAAIEKILNLSISEKKQWKDRSIEQSKKFSVKKMTDETIAVYEQFKR